MIKNKRGWIRILEATIAVLLVSGVLVVTYSNQPTHGQDSRDYVYNLQKRILADISSRSDLRGFVLDGDLDGLDNYVQGMVPLTYNYSLSVCNLGDVCKMDSEVYIATVNEQIYTESVIVSSDLGNGDSVVYSPKKVVMFVWENR